MDNMTSFTVSLAGIGIRFEFPFETEIPTEFRPFLAPDAPVQASYRAELHQQFCPSGEPVCEQSQQTIYRTERGWLRLFSSGIGVELTPEGENVIHFQVEESRRYRRNYTISPLLGMEYVLAHRERLLLHSSAVLYQGAAILFSGPSGVGKSTQADLWHQYAGAEVINGDRCVISRSDGGYVAHGSPFCGSSGIRRQVSAPLGAVIFLEQGQENRLQPVSCWDAYRRLYSQIIVNSWDEDYTKRVCSLIEGMINGIPMYVYYCRADASAVEFLKNALNA